MKKNSGVNKKRIFIVDDDVAIRDVLMIILEGEQYKINAFPSGKEALKRLEGEKPDLILLDYYLPDESAEQVIEEFRSRVDADLPIVLMSAHLKAFDIARRLEVQDFLAKPFQLETVLQAVRKSLC